MNQNLRSALGGLWREKWIHLVSVLSIAVGLFIITLGLIAVYNLHYISAKLPERFSLTLYLKEDVTPDQVENLLNLLKTDNNIQKVSYISKDNALAELKKSLKDSAYLLEGLEDNPLPASVEVKLKKDFIKSGGVQQLATELQSMNGVDEVQYGEQFLNSIQSVMSGAKAVGIVFLAVLFGGILFVCYSTVKILFYRKTDEVETLKLLGATAWFIRAPFLMQGSVIGAAGGALAGVASFAIFDIFLRSFAHSLPVFRYFLVPQEALLSLPVAGLMIGFSGALIALGRIRF